MAYLERQVDAARRHLSSRKAAERKAVNESLHEAEAERERIKDAIRTGKGGAAVPVLVEMLAEAEGKVKGLQAELNAEPKPAVPAEAIPVLVEKALRNLRSILGRDTDRARTLLSGLLGEIILTPDKHGLVAEVRGNLSGVLAGTTGSGGRI